MSSLFISNFSMLAIVVAVFQLLSICKMEENHSTSNVKWGYYCEFDRFNATCRPDAVVVMETALYGRMNKGTCVKADLGFVGCSSDVLDILDARCSGRRTCILQMPDQQLAARQPCMAELKTYLEASYRCQKVVSVEHGRVCRRGDTRPLAVGSTDSGYLANVVTIETGCGSPDSPWKIQVLPGQRINITLLNFATVNKDELAKLKVLPSTECQVYATIKEPNRQSTVTVCGSNVREERVYTSMGHALELRMMPVAPSDRVAHFLLNYAAIGCSDLTPPTGGWVQRTANGNDDVVYVGCNGSTSHSWSLACRKNEWKGDAVGSCIESTAWHETLGPMQFGSFTLAKSMSYIIVSIVAAFVGLTILIIGLVLVKRHYNRSEADLVYRLATEQQQCQSSHCPDIYNSPIDTTDRQKPAYADSFCEVDRDGYTHIWERPLPCPTMLQQQQQQYRQDGGPWGMQSKLTDSSSCPTGLAYGQRHAVAGLRGQVEMNCPMRVAMNGGTFVPNSAENRLPPPPDNVDDQRYYQLDSADDVSLTPT